MKLRPAKPLELSHSILAGQMETLDGGCARVLGEFASRFKQAQIGSGPTVVHEYVDILHIIT